MQRKESPSPAGLSYGGYMGKVVALNELNLKLADFDLFWEVYPRKKNKGDASKAWKQTEQLRPPIEQLIAAIEIGIRSPDWQRDGGAYIPYPASWLRAWGWEDE